jgi:hypothetical protein
MISDFAFFFQNFGDTKEAVPRASSPYEKKTGLSLTI